MIASKDERNASDVSFHSFFFFSFFLTQNKAKIYEKKTRWQTIIVETKNDVADVVR